MSGDILSQQEIDALLHAISTGQMNADELKKNDEVRKIKVYDFKRALRFSKDHLRSLERIYENFARTLTTYFSAQLRTYVNIQLSSSEQLPYEEFIQSIPKMTVLTVFELDRLEGRMLIEINPNIAYAMIDRLLGGLGRSVNKIDTITEIEKKLMIQLYERAFEQLGEAWENVVEFQAVLKELEVNPQFLQLVSSNETVVVITLAVTIGEVTGTINFCMPHVLLEPILSKLSSHYWIQNQQIQHTSTLSLELEKKLSHVQVPIVAELGQAEMSIHEFMQLDVGDIIPLQTTIDSPLIVKVDQEAKFYAQPGQKKKKLAIQIIGKLLKEETDE